jgi:nicotinate-nucleotide adenylyltransferase
MGYPDPLPRFGDRRRVRIGLLGGSFNPAHAGHRHIAEQFRRRLRLDQVWLLVSPGNPLKPEAGMAPLAARLASARAIADGRRLRATDLEARLGTRFTRDTLRLLRLRFPRARFVWLMGADILEQLPRWRGWREIVRKVPFAVHPRPSYNARARASPAAMTLRRALRAQHLAPALADLPPPAWVFLNAAQNPASASALRGAEIDVTEGERAIAHPKQITTATATPATPPRSTSGAPARKRAPRRKPTPQAEIERLSAVIAASLEDDKAENITTIDLAGRAAFAERMIIATGLADRQIEAMAAHLAEKLRAAGLKRVPIEGAGGADWVLLDAGDIIVHLFKPDARALYNLEKMWGADLDEPEIGVI